MRTALGQVRGLGSAKQGTGHFIASRVTAVALLPLAIAFIAIVVGLLGSSHETAVERLGSPLVAMVLVATLLLTIVHMRIGMQVIIEDYVHTDLAKYALLIANSLFSWAVGLASVFAVLKLAFGG